MSERKRENNEAKERGCKEAKGEGLKMQWEKSKYLWRKRNLEENFLKCKEKYFFVFFFIEKKKIGGGEGINYLDCLFDYHKTDTGSIL